MNPHLLRTPKILELSEKLSAIQSEPNAEEICSLLIEFCNDPEVTAEEAKSVADFLSHRLSYGQK